MSIPDFSLETILHGSGHLVVAGTDEVGRGPLAGPVYAAAVVLDPANIPDGLNDSKKLTAKRREVLAHQICEVAQVCVAHATVAEIDEHNILRASHIAMVRAVEGLAMNVDHVLVDGNMIPRGMGCPATAVIKGDGKSQSIAAASIVAKFRRDLVMKRLALEYPGYGWDKNAGYPTKMHLLALQNLGITPHHRRSFKPVHKML